MPERTGVLTFWGYSMARRLATFSARAAPCAELAHLLTPRQKHVFYAKYVVQNEIHPAVRLEPSARRNRRSCPYGTGLPDEAWAAVGRHYVGRGVRFLDFWPCTAGHFDNSGGETEACRVQLPSSSGRQTSRRRVGLIPVVQWGCTEQPQQSFKNPRNSGLFLVAGVSPSLSATSSQRSSSHLFLRPAGNSRRAFECARLARGGHPEIRVRSPFLEGGLAGRELGAGDAVVAFAGMRMEPVAIEHRHLAARIGNGPVAQKVRGNLRDGGAA